MFDFIYTLLAFIVAISILVAVHEFGHFWVAKKLGVKVLRYSIGFGRPIWKKKFGKDNTEYVIASLPLGGYVKMLDEREGIVSEHELHRSFNRQSVSKRIAIVSAGPVFNFIFAIAAYWLMLSLGVPGLKPILGDIASNSVLAKEGLQPNDLIVSINNQSTPIWDVAIQELVGSALKKETAEVAVTRGDGVEFVGRIDFSSIEGYEEPDEALKAIGLKLWRPDIEAKIGEVVKNSPAEIAGIHSNDVIISINGNKIKDWYGLVENVSENPNTPINIELLRNKQIHTLKATPKLIEHKGKKLGQLGVGPANKVIIDENKKSVYQYSLMSGLIHSLDKTWRNSVLTLKMIGKLITGQVSIKNLSGPINIAVYAGYSASAGLPRFLEFLAIISISLGVINLLPIPLLDGGHLMYYIAEVLKGSPVSEKVEIAGQKIGIAIILCMMILAIGNDLTRVFGG